MVHYRARILCVLIGVALASLGAPPVIAAPSPCSLVTESEASAAMGESSLPGALRNGRRHASCRYYSSDHRMNVFVQVVGAGDLVGAQQLGGRLISGIGDKAVWAGGSLFVQKGTTYAQVALYKSAASMSGVEPGVIKLGKLAAGRM